MTEQLNTSYIFERTDEHTNSPVVNSDPFADKAPVDAALIYKAPVDGAVAVVSPMDEMIVQEVEMSETPLYTAPVVERIADEYEDVSKSTPYKAPMGETVTNEAPAHTNAGSVAALLNREESEHFRTRWNEIQGKFVDEPRSAVQQADALVSDVIGQITQMFASEHSLLEGQWNQGNDVSTEDLRKALQRYRSFFNRLVV